MFTLFFEIQMILSLVLLAHESSAVVIVWQDQPVIQSYEDFSNYKGKYVK
jgi:hypothetical protein